MLEGIQRVKIVVIGPMVLQKFSLSDGSQGTLLNSVLVLIQRIPGKLVTDNTKGSKIPKPCKSLCI